MFNLIVTSFGRAQDILDTTWPTKAISTNSPDSRECVCRGDHHRIWVFDDCDKDCIDVDGIERFAPTFEQIEEIMEFTSTFTDDDNVLIHCKAGKSRSTAIAIGALVQHGMEPQEALDLVTEIRNKHSDKKVFIVPNILIIQMIDDILELDGKLNAVVQKHFSCIPIIGGPPLLLMGYRHLLED